MEAVHSADPGRNGSVSFQRNSGKKNQLFWQKKKLFILVEKKLFILVEKKTSYFGRKKKQFNFGRKKTLLSLIVVSFSTKISKICVAMCVALYLAIYVAMYLAMQRGHNFNFITGFSTKDFTSETILLNLHCASLHSRFSATRFFLSAIKIKPL